jgi:putative ABC transport system permease protein
MLLALLLVLRGDLLDRWQQQLPRKAQLFPDQHCPGAGQPVKTFLAEHQVATGVLSHRARPPDADQRSGTEGNKDEALNRELNPDLAGGGVRS